MASDRLAGSLVAGLVDGIGRQTSAETGTTGAKAANPLGKRNGYMERQIDGLVILYPARGSDGRCRAI